jgi:putative membrane-bound dehydrogenase-like protein
MRNQFSIGAAVIICVLVNIDDRLDRRVFDMRTATQRGDHRTSSGAEELAARERIVAFLNSRLLHHVRVKFPVIVASVGLACKVFGAELRVEDKDMPRVPPTEPAQAIATLQVRDGFRAELVAHEPQVMSPVAIAFDENAKMFVAEMRDYSERRDERLGRIKLLEDTDGDGRFDKATIYATNLPWPTAVICWDGGVFVGASPDILYFKDTNSDGIADVRRVVFTGFGNQAAKLNVQALLNSFTWGIDNRIHGALGGNASIVTNLARPGTKPLELRGRDFSFDPRTFEMRAESGGGQWGISFDDEGNKFVCNNSRHIAVEMYDDRYAARNRFYSMPAPDVSIAADGPAAEVFRLSPDEPWRVIRTKWRVAGLVPGPVEGGGRASGYFTGAAGAMIYRGDAFPPEFHGDAFIADCGSNLIHRKKIRRNGLNFVAERADDEQRREFIASRDNWFRPVSFANAPDGTLYVADMYRETIEHPWSLPPELKSKLDLNSGHDRGRIYRIVPTNFQQPKAIRLGKADTRELVKTLERSNGWHRDTASRLICERHDTNAIPLLRQLMRGSTLAAGRVHALYALKSLRAFEFGDAANALRDTNAIVRVHAVRIAEERFRGITNKTEAATWISAVRELASDSDVCVRYAVALADNDSVTLTRIIQRDVEDPWMRAAVLNGLSQGAADVFAALAANREFSEHAGATEFLRELARIAGASEPWQRLALGLRVTAGSTNSLTYATAIASGLERRGTSMAAVDRKSFERLNDQARRVAIDASQPEPRRVEATELLGFSVDPESRTVLFQTLDAPSVPLQKAALMALSKRYDRTFINIFDHWQLLARETRTRAVSMFIARGNTALDLLRAVEQGRVARTELAPADIQRLTSHPDEAVRAKAKKLFTRNDAPRADLLKKFRPALDTKGDASRGHAIYEQRCVMCHRAGTEGFAVGPDLAAVAANGKEKLLASIIDPNAEVAAGFVAYTIETKRAESFVGILGGENPLAVILKMPNGETMRLGRENIAVMRGSDKSLMPEGLEEGLSVQDMADLLEFLVQAKPAP